MKRLLTLCAGVLLFHFSITRNSTTYGFEVNSNSSAASLTYNDVEVDGPVLIENI